jgi:hypothetical protein
MDGEPEGLPVLQELIHDRSSKVRELAQEGINRIQSGEKGSAVFRAK